MTLGVWHFFATQVDGNNFVKLLPNAQVTVRRESDGGLAALEQDIDGSSPGLDNPFTVDSSGEIVFYADDSERYRIDISDGATTLTLRQQSVSVHTPSLRNTAAPVNLSLAASIAANALTMAVKTSGGNDASPGDSISIPFRSATAGSGAVVWQSLISDLSLTVPTGATLGHMSGENQHAFWYLLNGSGTIELAVSGRYFGNHGIVSTSANNDSSDSRNVMYSTTARSNVPFICIGFSEHENGVAGNWSNAPSAVHLAPFAQPGWTKSDPTITLSEAGTIPQYATNDLRYCRVGDVVHCKLMLTGDGGDEGSGAGLIRVALPFPIATDQEAVSHMVCGIMSDGTAEFIMEAGFEAGADYVRFAVWDAISTRGGVTASRQDEVARTIQGHFFYQAEP